jgi:hypothetical protein
MCAAGSAVLVFCFALIWKPYSLLTFCLIFYTILLVCFVSFSALLGGTIAQNKRIYALVFTGWYALTLLVLFALAVLWALLNIAG